MKRLPGKRGEHQYESAEVLYLIGNINYSYLHLSTGEVVMSCRTLKWFSDRWVGFLRVHKNALINVQYVQDLRTPKNTSEIGYVVMANNAQIAIARRRTQEVVALLQTMIPQPA